MSGRGRTLKYEYLHGARTVADYKKLLPEFVQWYNTLRPHQALKYATPVEILQGKAYGYVDKANALPTCSQAQQQQKTLLFFDEFGPTNGVHFLLWFLVEEIEKWKSNMIKQNIECVES